MKVLVFGSSGSGKTYCSKVLSGKGYPVFDADLIKGLHGWYDADGKQVEFPDEPDIDFFNNHDFYWDRDYLKRFLNEHDHVYLFGLSGNIFEMLDLFDKVYFLDTTDNIIIDRLKHVSRENPTGKTEEQREMILNYTHKMRKRARNHKIPFLDASMSPVEIYEIISNNEYSL